MEGANMSHHFQSPTTNESPSHSPAESISTLDDARSQQVLHLAGQAYQSAADWASFFRDVLGVNGIIQRYFTTGKELAEFEKTAEYAEIQQMVARLRENNGRRQRDDLEPTRVITVRMPQSLHEYLRKEADSKQTSMNKLCISKLLQIIDDRFLPTE
jgi:predicted HicB family RNase H-like nuclease